MVFAVQDQIDLGRLAMQEHAVAFPDFLTGSVEQSLHALAFPTNYTTSR